MPFNHLILCHALLLLPGTVGTVPASKHFEFEIFLFNTENSQSFLAALFLERKKTHGPSTSKNKKGPTQFIEFQQGLASSLKNSEVKKTRHGLVESYKSSFKSQLCHLLSR